MAEVVATLGGLPDVVAAALKEATFDAVNHHRRHVLKHNQMPSMAKGGKQGKGGQKLLASLLHRYSRASDNAARPMDISGESFGAAQLDKLLENLERGAMITTREAMAIPIDGGMATIKGQQITHANFRKFLAQRKLDIVPTKRGALLVHKARASKAQGMRSVVYGILLKRRKQRPLMGFEKAWTTIEARHVAKFDRILEQAITEAGRAKLGKQLEARQADTAAYKAELAKLVAANGGKVSPQIKAAATKAAKAARALAIEKGKGDS